ncbi:MAG: alpha-D-ribose 1-methylphosphonate 5-triphosphate diphosphatase, partial [Egibacteraceae bacterium]
MFALTARRVLTGRHAAPRCWVTVDPPLIVAVEPEPLPGAVRVDAGDADLIPGLVDLHSDCLEERARPRPTNVIPLRDALVDLDIEVVAHGLTTHFLCVALIDDQAKNRTLERAVEIIDALEDLRGELRADHWVHLRVELTGDGVGTVEALAARDVVRMVSYMDHTPGQGQFSDEALYRAYYATGKDNLETSLALRYERQDRIEPARQAVASATRAGGAVLAAHDDDSEDAIVRGILLGVRVSEFPVTAEAAKAAHDAGIGVVMGAPNARRGTSHMANLSAREALASGWLDGLASDYHPPSMLAAAYLLAGEPDVGWPRAVGLVTAGPARLAGLADRGVIAPGQRADLV